MTNKHISQMVSKEGKPIAPATSAPGCFIHDGAPLEKFSGISWGKTFSEPLNGNHVEFYVTGEEYFTAVAAAIGQARESIFITGWQVNFDVELVKGRTLFQCLEEAIDKNSKLHIYVMPWLSPKVGVDTGDFETMLAVFQLNAGLPPPARAFALPAIAQGDMAGGLGIGFSHHQKLVVIDNERAFVGGIDLAYGRRDNGKFTLAANGRSGNELYSPCVPATHELSHVEQTKYLTRAELLAACFDGKAGSAATFLTSAPLTPIARAQDMGKSVTDTGKDAYKYADDWWKTTDLMPEFVRKLQDVPVDAAQKVSRWAYRLLDREVSGKLERLRASGSAHAADSAVALLAWLNNASMEQLPHRLRQGTVTLMETFMIATMTHLSNSADQRPARYENLKKLGRIVPASGKVISDAQPRMPWHDVHSSIVGPSVSDLSRNFILRWNGIAQRYERSHATVTGNPILRTLFSSLGLQPTAKIKIPRIPDVFPARKQEKAGKCWVQVLRSAPSTMLRDEAQGMAANNGSKAHPALAQNNCLKAMLTVIQGAQKFIYIEGQFFQSAYGLDLPDEAQVSGPMSTLIDITSSSGYKTYARRLGIEGVPPEKMLSAIQWSQIDDVRADVKGKGADFMNDLYRVLKNIAAIEATKAMGKAQQAIINPIGEALAQRIETAIHDGLPFHVYMVLPVHPEGTLNTLNIMTQLHLTMQSLVFGEDCLVNRIRRAILVGALRTSKKIGKDQAKEMVAGYELQEVIAATEDQWKKYLTLLNLRNWETLGKRPVTEQIYVHSKLLIADDRVAILGSANINDRSQLGNRDSELAVIVRDDAPIQAKLDGVHSDPVSAKVHDLRMRLPD
jgi:phospholipase D1/2